MSSAPARALAAAVLALCAVGCSGGSGGPATGKSLQGGGPPMFGIIGFPHAVRGKVYRFSFPLLKNIGTSPVSVTSVRVVSVPAQVEILGYSVYSVKDTPGYLLNGPDSDFSEYPDYGKKPYTIRPGSLSEFYANVRVKVIGKVTEHLQNCDVRYTQGGHAYHQVLHCEYALDGT